MRPWYRSRVPARGVTVRIVLDLQACQGESRERGIGRYSWALAEAMLRNGAKHHEFWIALNAAFPQSVTTIRGRWGGTRLPVERIVTWQSETPVEARVTANEPRLERGLAVREAFLESLRPDFVHIASLFEGMSDNSLHSVPAAPDAAPVAVTLYDLIPLLNRVAYLPNFIARDWYYRQLDSLRRARLLLAISESSRGEALESLGTPPDRVINISSAVGEKFRPLRLSADAAARVRHKFRIMRPFVMCAGVVESRKNIDALIRAFAALPSDLRAAHQLVLVGKVGARDDERFLKLMREGGLRPKDVVMTGFVNDDDLIALYNLCKVFVFPSWHEGFGLPALEAMACGAPVIAAGTSSLPEVVGREDALFDPHDDESIRALLARTLRDDAFRGALAAHGLERAKLFSWDKTAQRALAAMEAAAEHSSHLVAGQCKPRLAYVPLASAVRTHAMHRHMPALRALAGYYEIELITDDPQIDPVVPTAWPVRSVRWFLAHAKVYDRVLYHTTDLLCPEHEAACMQRVPGTVLLQRGSADGVAAARAAAPLDGPSLRRKLYQAWGYCALAEVGCGDDWTAIVSRYPLVYADVASADGLIVAATAGERELEWNPGEPAGRSIRCMANTALKSKGGDGRSPSSVSAVDPAATAAAWRDAIDQFHVDSQGVKRRRAAADLVARTAGIEPEPGDMANAAQALADAYPPNLAQRQLLVDISRLVVTDARSGIQRVVRSHLANLLRDPPAGFRVEPVYARHEESFYRYARKYTCGFLGVDALAIEDDRLDAAPGDVFLGLDLAADVVPVKQDYLLDLKRHGVSIHFVFYDALAGRHADWFPADLVMWMRRWYSTIAEVSDSVVAISRASADELRAWLDGAHPSRNRPLQISWAHLGADIKSSMPSRGVDASLRRVMAGWQGASVFLMVGTVEPRKGQPQALDAFEQLWSSGREERLVIVGHLGWRMEAFAERLRGHPELGKRLFWFEGISDEALEAVYAASSALLAASFAEGFGLPLIEAAQHGLPILARDLPVFHEVAGDAASYFRADDPAALAAAIADWVARAQRHELPDVSSMRYLTWKESTAQLLDAIAGTRECVCWRPAAARQGPAGG